MEGGFPGYFAFDWLVWWGTRCGDGLRFLGWECVVHTKVECGSDRVSGTCWVEDLPRWAHCRGGEGVGIVDVGNLGIQKAIEVLLLVTVVFLPLNFPGMSKALGIGQWTRRLSFKETTKLGGSS